MQCRCHHKSEGCRHAELCQCEEHIPRLCCPDDETPDAERRVEAEGLDDPVKQSLPIDPYTARHLPYDWKFRWHECEQHRARKLVIEDRLAVDESPRCKKEENAEQADLSPCRSRQRDECEAAEKTGEQGGRAVQQDNEASGDQHHQDFRAGFECGILHRVIFPFASP